MTFFSGVSILLNFVVVVFSQKKMQDLQFSVFRRSDPISIPQSSLPRNVSQTPLLDKGTEDHGTPGKKVEVSYSEVSRDEGGNATGEEVDGGPKENIPSNTNVTWVGLLSPISW